MLCASVYTSDPARCPFGLALLSFVVLGLQPDMAGSDVLHLPLPDQVYRDALMEYAVLEAFRELHWEQTGHRLPPALSMALYNDILAYARTVLDEANFTKLVAYADSLCQQVPGVRCSVFPPQLMDAPETGSPANSLAEELLSEGMGSLWGASRQVIALLPFRAEKRLSNTAELRVVRLGAYGHHSFCGMCNMTADNRSVCVLLNGLVRLLRPEHVWTTLVIILLSTVRCRCMWMARMRVCPPFCWASVTFMMVRSGYSTKKARSMRSTTST